MRNLKFSILVMVFAVYMVSFLFPGKANCDMYKYTDERGTIVIVNSIEEVPKKFRKKAQKIKGGNVSVISGENSAETKKMGDFIIKSKKSIDKPTASIPLIVFFEAWSSRLLFSTAIILITGFVLLFGFYLTFDLPERNDRVKFKILLTLSWMFMMINIQACETLLSKCCIIFSVN